MPLPLMQTRVCAEALHPPKDVMLPGREFSVDRVPGEDVHVALREAFDDMKRQLRAGTSFGNLGIGAQVQFIPATAAEGLQAKRGSVGRHGAP